MSNNEEKRLDMNEETANTNESLAADADESEEVDEGEQE